MDLVEIFTNASTYELVGTGAGLALAGGVHYLLNGMSKGFQVVAGLAAVGADTILTLAGSRGERAAPPPPSVLKKLGEKAVDLVIPVVFYGAAAMSGFVTGAGIESITTKNAAQNTIPAVENLSQTPVPR